MVKVGVLALQGDVREHSRALDGAGATAVPIKTRVDLSSVDALVLPGGESTTIGKLLERFGLLQPVVERARSGMPLFGTCAGMILMAKEITGPELAPLRLKLMDISVKRNAYGRQVDSFEADLDVESLDAPLTAAFIRAPVVERVGACVEVLARWEDRPVLVRQGNLLAASFHPEITGDHRLHELFVSSVEG
ncbi:MAG: pyridoxal 5'-phosphate synthase glutaminase subunit PdxT [Actinobacteria bacterium]|nr:pyridoxal 5'-phosphate synthase glutaminase subunit PdxT [Actinomycetota bacterium]MDQ3217443.1 pyridoxal 5'-phosphate synthase glutaminase subunit PdxT [Actinomycetota bacterium]